MSSYETISIERRGEHVGLITLDRPSVANALNTQMGLELRDLFDQLNAAPEDYRALVLTGRGERAFCAGGDLKERYGMTDAVWARQHLVFERMIRAFMLCPVPIIAAVNGAAYGGGCELALCCDFIFASRNARFALTEVTLGIIPGSGGTQTLPRAIGSRRASEMILSGEPIDAAKAIDWGLVNRVCEPETLVAEALGVAGRIAANAPLAVRQAKHAVRVGEDLDLRTGLMFEIEAYNVLPPTEDRKEGVRAFIEERPARFVGR